MSRYAKAIVFKTCGNPLHSLSIKNIPLREMQANDIELEFMAAPVNPADLNQIQGVYPIKARFDHQDGFAVGGNEGVAIVSAIGRLVNSVKPGDWVVPAITSFGTWRTHAICRQEDVLKINSTGIDPILAGTLCVNPCSAFRMLKDYVSLEPGDVVIQNGANSAVGQCVIQLCRAWGLKSINVVRSRNDFQALEAKLMGIGADAVVTEENLRTVPLLRTFAAPRLALNCVGGKSATNITRFLGNNSPLVTYGGMSKEPVIIPTSLYIFKNISSRGFWLTAWNEHADQQKRKEMLDEILHLARTNQFQAPSHRKLSWDSLNITDILDTSTKQILTLHEMHDTIL